MPGQYFVQVVASPEETFGPYGLRSAQDFARIVSQYGGDRLVVKRSPADRWQRIRLYREGRRIWPTTRAQARRLEGSEIPGSFRANPGGDPHEELVHSVADAALFDNIASVVEYAVEDGLVDADDRVEVMNYIHGRGYTMDQLEEAAGLVEEVLELHHAGSSDELVDRLDADDLEQLGYYIYMQTAGHGVAWSDDHDEELYTPDWTGHGFVAYLDAEDALREWLEE